MLVPWVHSVTYFSLVEGEICSICKMFTVLLQGVMSCPECKNKLQVTISADNVSNCLRFFFCLFILGGAAYIGWICVKFEYLISSSHWKTLHSSISNLHSAHHMDIDIRQSFIDVNNPERTELIWLFHATVNSLWSLHGKHITWWENWSTLMRSAVNYLLLSSSPSCYK